MDETKEGKEFVKMEKLFEWIGDKVEKIARAKGNDDSYNEKDEKRR
jgi:hypothetical protein|tara:strand:- start:562 stop:699 length:138 start_codon:yes stop_codon:yes gene_type:complete